MRTWNIEVIPYDLDRSEWVNSPPQDCVVILDLGNVALGEALVAPKATLGLGPAWGERDVQAFVDREIQPRLTRLETGQWHDDGWEQSPSGRWQLMLNAVQERHQLPPDPFGDEDLDTP